MFLMLLSFFIVLNSMSTFEKDATVPAVLNSLNLAFSNNEHKLIKDYINIGPSPIPSPVTSPYGGSGGEGDTLETIEGLFNTHLAGFKAKRNRLGTVMHVSLPIGEFEDVVETSGFDVDQGGDAGSVNFSQTMITLLRSAKNGRPYRIDMVYNLKNDPMILMRGAPDTFKSALRRVSGLAEDLEAKGMPKKMISVGLVKGRAGFIDLYFYRYKPLSVPDDIKQIREKETKTQSVKTSRQQDKKTLQETRTDNVSEEKGVDSGLVIPVESFNNKYNGQKEKAE